MYQVPIEALMKAVAERGTSSILWSKRAYEEIAGVRATPAAYNYVISQDTPANWWDVLKKFETFCREQRKGLQGAVLLWRAEPTVSPSGSGYGDLAVRARLAYLPKEAPDVEGDV